MSAHDGLEALRAGRDRARMIADAAPDLHAALAELLRVIECASSAATYAKAIEAGHAALAKARGES